MELIKKTTIKQYYKSRGMHGIFKCKYCGIEKEFYIYDGKRRKSCGCVRYNSLVGEKYGNLTVIKHVETSKKNQRLWECKCDCGNIVTHTTTWLNSGRVRSCGCLKKEKDHAKRSKIVYLYENHLTYEEIIYSLNCRSKTITSALNEAGISRTRGKNQRTEEQKQHAYRIMYGE